MKTNKTLFQTFRISYLSNVFQDLKSFGRKSLKKFYKFVYCILYIYSQNIENNTVQVAEKNVNFTFMNQPLKIEN